jgi:hypothetical protein
MSSEKDPSEGWGLKERWDRLDQREKAHEAEGRWLEDERWGIASELYGAWNPHDDPVTGRRGKGATPRDGRDQQTLAAELGRSVATVWSWIHVWRRFGRDDQRPSFGEALAIVKFGGVEKKRASWDRAAGRKALRALREHPEALAPEIAQALARPEVVKAVKPLMPPEALIEMLPDPVVEPVPLSAIEPEAEPAEDEPARIPKHAPSGQLRPVPQPSKTPTDEERIKRSLRALSTGYAALMLADLSGDLDDEQREYAAETLRKIIDRATRLERQVTGKRLWRRAR